MKPGVSALNPAIYGLGRFSAVRKSQGCALGKVAALTELCNSAGRALL